MVEDLCRFDELVDGVWLLNFLFSDFHDLIYGDIVQVVGIVLLHILHHFDLGRVEVEPAKDGSEILNFKRIRRILFKGLANLLDFLTPISQV